jgi:hypothetical protein
MTNFERSVQFWALLVQAARTQQVLSYEQVEKMTGIPRFGQTQILANILYYCQSKGLPHLTCIVIEKATGMPASDDFAGLDLSAEIRRVFVYDWLSLPNGAPQVADFQQVATAMAI